MKEDNTLPFAIKLAGKTIALDNIKIISTEYYIPVRKSIGTLKIGDWEKRLLNKSILFISNDIKKSLAKNKDCKLYIYIFGYIKPKLLYATVELSYEIK